MLQSEGMSELMDRHFEQPLTERMARRSPAAESIRRDDARGTAEVGQAEHAPIGVLVLGDGDIDGRDAEDMGVGRAAAAEERQEPVGAVAAAGGVERRARQGDGLKHPDPADEDLAERRGQIGQARPVEGAERLDGDRAPRRRVLGRHPELEIVEASGVVE